jgi:MoxR-like ATPase
VVELVDATRRSELLLRGGSPRATLATVAMAKAVAQLRGRDYVIPTYVQEVFVSTVAHRVHAAPGADHAEELLQELMSAVHPPKLR